MLVYSSKSLTIYWQEDKLQNEVRRLGKEECNKMCVDCSEKVNNI